MVILTPLVLAIIGALLVVLGLVLEYRKSPAQVFKHYSDMLEGGDSWSWNDALVGGGFGCLIIAGIMAFGGG